ncbi:NAD(P)/FAD-dependent oxidoreductase [Caproicibacter sp.]|uniref:NAD(P)/FAD-dependent oxidoreductase n=1 Tax=Caproicibacter sp. TaxID=2814884 RepID=UPI0039897201
MLYDVLISGGGPAGMTAAIYAARSGLSTLLLTGPAQGGQVAYTNVVENYPGFPVIYGTDLAQKLSEHVQSAGVQTAAESAEKLELSGAVKTIRTAEQTYSANTVILAQGSERRKLNIPGEQEFAGRGVSYCATCDGNFFRNRTVAVIGGGNTAVGDAIELSGLCKRVILVNRSDQLRAMEYLVERAKEHENVEFLYGYESVEIQGSQKVEHLVLKERSSGKQKILDLDGVFVAIGVLPNSQLLEGILPLKDGFVEAPESCETPLPGVFAAGDLRKKELYQIVTAISDGANAAHSALLYLQNHPVHE